MERLPKEALSGVRWNSRVADAAGFLDAFDAHYGEIIGGVKLEDMPSQELKVLRELGSEDPESELTALIYMVNAPLASLNECVTASDSKTNFHQLSDTTPWRSHSD